MFLGRINNTPTVADVNIPIAVEFNTNSKIGYNGTTDEIVLRKPGLYNVDGAITATGVAGDVDIDIIADGAIRRTFTATLAAADDFVTIPIIDALRVVYDEFQNVADLSLQTSLAGLTLTGVIRVEYVQ